MAYQTLATFNLTGLFGLFVYAGIVTNGLFPKLLLGFVWCVFVAGSYFAQKNLIGVGDLPQSLAVGGFFLAVSSIFLRIIDTGVDGYYLISVGTFSVCLVVSALSVLFFLLSSDY